MSGRMNALANCWRAYMAFCWRLNDLMCLPFRTLLDPLQDAYNRRRANELDALATMLEANGIGHEASTLRALAVRRRMTMAEWRRTGER